MVVGIGRLSRHYSGQFFVPHVTRTTRGASILDLVISSEEELVSNLNIGPSIGRMIILALTLF